GPEQFLGRHAGPFTDQFSFCIALYEGLYGQRPFSGEGIDALAGQVLSGNIRAVEKPTQVPSGVHGAVLRGLSVAPEDRYPSMDALLVALREAAGADAPRPVGERPRKVRRRQWQAVALALAAIAISAIAGFIKPDRRTAPGGRSVAVGEAGSPGSLG